MSKISYPEGGVILDHWRFQDNSSSFSHQVSSSKLHTPEVWSTSLWWRGEANQETNPPDDHPVYFATIEDTYGIVTQAMPYYNISFP